MRRKELNIERVRAAYQAGSWVSWHQLAQEAGISHPTLSRLVSGQIKAVNPATLERLARALRVPAEWLTDERDDLPYVPQWLPWKQKGPSLWERPTADLVRHSWLMQQVEAALRRDLGDWYAGQAHDAYESWGHGLMAVFSELSSVLVWRAATLVPRSAGYGDFLHSDESPTIDWLLHLLKPWFAGQAYLNAPVLRGVFEALIANPGRLWGSEIRDADAVRALEHYATLCDKAERERLEAVLGPEEE